MALAPFASAPADSAAGALATELFAESLLGAQRLELLELGAPDSASRAAADSLGAAAVFLGELVLTSDRPRGSLSRSGMNLRSTVTAELRVRLISTESGGTLWRSSAQRRGTVGRLAVSAGGLPTMSVRDREEAYGELVRDLVGDVTRDLRETWVRE